MQSLFLKILKCGLFFGCFLTFTVHAEQPQTFSIQLKQAPLVPTLQQLALAQNVNLLIDDELQGTLTLKLDNVDLDQLFRSVAKIKQLDLWQEDLKPLHPYPQRKKHRSQLLLLNCTLPKLLKS